MTKGYIYIYWSSKLSFFSKELRSLKPGKAKGESFSWYLYIFQCCQPRTKNKQTNTSDYYGSHLPKKQKAYIAFTNQGYELYRQLANRKARKRKVSQATSFRNLHLFLSVKYKILYGIKFLFCRPTGLGKVPMLTKRAEIWEFFQVFPMFYSQQIPSYNRHSWDITPKVWREQKFAN